MYDPQIGRWHCMDAMVENGHHNYTPYAYVYNNPLRFIDPFGLDSNDVNIPQTEGSDMDGWGNEAPVEEEFTNPFSMKSEKESKRENTDENNEEKSDDPLDPSNFDTFEEYKEAVENTPETAEIREKHKQEAEKLEKRWKRQDNIVAGAEGVGIVVGAAVEFTIGWFTGISILTPPDYGQGPYYDMPPMEQ